MSNEETDYIWAYEGMELHILEPDEHSVQPEIVAPSLAHVTRWNGHARSHYSVAQHQVIASYLSKPEKALELAVHDVHEAITGDISSPMKKVIQDLAGWKLLKMIERGIDKVVEAVYDVKLEGDAEIHLVDLICARLEATHRVKVPMHKLDGHLGPEPEAMEQRLEWLPFTLAEAMRPWPAGEAEERWLHRINFLRRQRAVQKQSQEM